jgi:hypothetical protein
LTPFDDKFPICFALFANFEVRNPGRLIEDVRGEAALPAVAGSFLVEVDHARIMTMLRQR